MSPTDLSILTALTAKVPFLTLEQGARTWWDASPSGQDQAKGVLRNLVGKRFLWTGLIEAHPEIPIEAPLFAWHPGGEEPAYARIARTARRRFPARDSTVRVFLATSAAAKVFGGTAGKLKPASTTHDLHLGAVYLRLLRTDPTRADRWVSEATLAPDRADQFLPDAALVAEDGSLELVIEMVGSSYPAERLRRIHLDCEGREVPYELW